MRGEGAADVVLVRISISSSSRAPNNISPKGEREVFYLTLETDTYTKIAHGHILRAFTKRWLKYPMDFPLSMMIEPGGIGTLSYQHHNVAEPAFVLGMAIPAE